MKINDRQALEHFILFKPVELIFSVSRVFLLHLPAVQ